MSPTLHTPNDSQPITDSEAPSTLPATKKVLAGPANPGVVRSRNQGVLSRLPSESDVLEVFANLRRDDKLTDEEAFLKLIANYDISISLLNRISSNVYPTLHRQFICVASLAILLISSMTYSYKVASVV